MLRIFVPVVSALGLALLGYRFTLRSGLRSRRAQARPTIQCQVIDDVQQALKTFWVVGGQLLGYHKESVSRGGNNCPR
jgi:hypothetical protein